MEMFINGVRTGLIEKIILKVPQMLLQALQQDWPKPCEEATGEARAGTAGVHHAASVHRTVAAIDWVSV